MSDANTLRQDETPFPDFQLPPHILEELQPHFDVSAIHESAPSEDVTRLFGEPGWATNAGESYELEGGHVVTPERSSWSWRTAETCESLDPADHLDVLMQRLPDLAAFETLHQEGWRFEVYWYAPTYDEASYFFQHRHLVWLAATHASLGVGVNTVYIDLDQVELPDEFRITDEESEAE